MNHKPIRVLLADDDEDDFIIIRNLLAESSLTRLELDWASSFKTAMDHAARDTYDVYLCDYLFEAQSGIELMQTLRQNGLKAPIIILTGKGTREIDMTAMKAGADDYLEKTSLTAQMLERSIRYAMERRKTVEELRLSEKRLQALSEKLVSVQENERKLISRELHDSIGSSLTAIKFALEAKLKGIGKGSAAAQQISIEQIICMVRDTIEESRRISTRLRPALLDDMGILKTILWVCRKTQEICAGIQIETCLDIEEMEVPEHLKIVICRITQEALNNAAKHSKADKILVLLKRLKSQLELVIEDNGEGFNPAACQQQDAGLGITNMRERTELSGGLFRLRSEKGKGTRVEVLWKLDPAKSAG